MKTISSLEDLTEIRKIGVDKIADIVKRTLGPGGLPIIIERTGQALDGSPLGPRITKDGVSVAQECFDPDPLINVVIQAVKDICKKTNTDAGDGTTTAVTLGQAITRSISDYEGSDINPQHIRRSVEAASAEVIKQLRELAKEVDTDMIREVATISANGDKEVGRVIAEAFAHVGAKGVVTVDEGVSRDITIEKVDGYQFNRGAEGRDAFFNSSSNTHFEVENETGVAVVIFDGNFTTYTDLIPFLNLVAGVEDGIATKEIPPIILVANEFSRDVIQFLLIQKAELGLTVCPVKGPHTTNVRSGYYDDLAYYTGATRLGNGNRSMTAIELDDIGYVEKAVITKYTTTLYDGFGEESAILNRVHQLESQQDSAESPYDKQVLGDRIAALTNGVAKIGVGGATDLEIKERYDRIEDALNAARAAIQEGVIPGGGVTLLRIASAIDGDSSIGHAILKEALTTPFYQILENIGMSYAEISSIIDDVLDGDGLDATSTYDSAKGGVVDAYESGILDPVKVTCKALENAVSIATILSTSGGAITYNRVLEKVEG